MSPLLVVAVSLAYLLTLFAVAAYGDRRAAAGRSVIASPWVYALSLAVYCSAWTYFGSVGRAASSGVWFLPIYLGPMLAMVLAWLVLRKMLRIAQRYRITSIADFISSRYGKSPLLAGLVTLITVVGIVPYIALQLKGISVAFDVLTAVPAALARERAWWQESTVYLALALAGFTMMFGARHLDSSERHEGMVAAVAFESVVKLLAFLAIGIYVSWGLFDGVGDIFARAAVRPELASLFAPGQGMAFAHPQWFALTLLAMLSVLLLPRQFQLMVVENVDERHLRRAAWVFPLYLLLINLFVLPIALGGLLHFGPGQADPETFVLSLPLSQGQPALALLAFVGGLSAATGMVIVETIAVSTMVCNDLVVPVLLRTRRWSEGRHDLTRAILHTRRLAILAVMLLGYCYFRLAGEAYALVSIGLISFAAVAQFAPAMLGGMYWRGATRHGALAGLLAGFALWCYTLMLPSLAKSGWMADGFLRAGPWGLDWLRPEALLGLGGFDPLTHALFWSLLGNVGLYVGVSLWRSPSVAEASQALLFVDVFERSSQLQPVFWRGQASVASLLALAERFLGPERARELFERYAREHGRSDLTRLDLVDRLQPLQADAELVHFVETQLTGAIGSASARVMVASVVEEEALALEDVLAMVEEAKRLLLHSRELEQKSLSLERASAELRAANEQLKSLDRLKDDFMSSVTHELRTPLTSIRALAELMLDDARAEAGGVPGMRLEQRQNFLAIIVAETERLGRLVNQVLDMAKIESGHAEWQHAELDLVALIRRSADTVAELLRERGAQLTLDLPESPVILRADPDRLTQVMINLLSNAAKFVPAGSGQIRIGLVLQRDRVQVEVQDNGPGVSPEQQALVFEKFRQGGDASHRPQGTGLGLPISRQIIEHFGGQIELRSQPGQGACFSFWLPLGAPDNDKTGDRA
jgi:Na+/proline symporter/nitrogen-specific signal transduction histidine kinase